MSAQPDAIPSPVCSATAGRRARIIMSSPGIGTLWYGAWLFTIGVAQLDFWKSVYAVVVWPYYLGVLAR